MSELRFDPLRRRWVIVASERALGPADFRRDPPPPRSHSCPLCPGNERYTGPEVFALRGGNTPANQAGWRVRVVPNKYPILRVEGDLLRSGRGLYDRVNGIGAHEVVVETPEHDLSLADLSVEGIREVLMAFRHRLNDLARDARFRYVMVFKNHGADAGARLDHSHSQVIAIPEIPHEIGIQLEAARDHFRRKERCLLCDVLGQELSEGERVVLEGSRFVAFAPYASSLPFELTLCPTRHGHDFGAQDDEDLLHLASVLKDVLGRLDRALARPAYNLALHTAPPPHPRPGRGGSWDSLAFDWHWHLSVAPRLLHIAGFEWSTGFYVNSVVPEEAARFLREVDR